MNLGDKIRRIRSFLNANPAYRHIPCIVIDDRAVSLEEAISYLERGLYVDRILNGLSKLGIDPDWRLVEEYYKRLAAAHPEVRIYALSEYVPAMSPAEALEHIRKRDKVGRMLYKQYMKLLEFMRLRMEVV